MQETVATIGGVILPTFESVETFTPEQFWLFVQQREEQNDLYHYELLDGRIYMTPPAGGPHASVQGNLFTAVSNFVRTGRLGRVFGSSAGYRMPLGRNVVEPDIAFVSNERLASMPPMEDGKFLEVAPDLMIEVLSASHEKNDLVLKREIYERNSVREYWIVDPRSMRIQVLVLAETRFREDQDVGMEGTVESRVLPGFRITAREAFER